MSELLLDRAGRRRSPATMPGFHAGRPPHNKGLRYPADPPKVEEIIAVMRAAGDRTHGRRLRALIVLLWRAGLRIHEALALTEGDLDQRRGSLLIRRGKGGRRREVGLDTWGWEELRPWFELRPELRVGALLCVINGTTCGRHWSPAAARAELRRTAAAAGVRRRFAPHPVLHRPRRRARHRTGDDPRRLGGGRRIRPRLPASCRVPLSRDRPGHRPGPRGDRSLQPGGPQRQPAAGAYSPK
jgi:integrase